MTEEADAELVRRIRAGDANALAEFAEARRAPLLAHIDRQLSSAMKRKIEAEDLLQETVAEAVRSLPQMDLADRDPFGWLCHVAGRRIVDAHRRLFGAQKRDANREVLLGSPAGGSSSRTPLVDLLVASMTTATQKLVRKDREQRMETALATLPSDQQEALRLRYVDGLPSKEIAERLGKTDGAVRVMLTRSLAKLQALLGEDG
jgi:RNA polymerase sigma-70 factor (ECF subfamily)